jgi:hypothetical protein
MSSGLRLVITKDAPDVFPIRNHYIYPSPFDERYWDGGLHFALSEDRLRAEHERDAGSYFVLAFSEAATLEAYARFSLVADSRPLLGDWFAPANPSVVLYVHVIVALPRIRGIELLWNLAGSTRRGKFGPVVYDAILTFGSSHRAELAVADVYVAPIPNLPSFCLHRKLGFDVLGGPLGSCAFEIEGRGPEAVIHFTRLVKPLTAGAHISRQLDGRPSLSEEGLDGDTRRAE